MDPKRLLLILALAMAGFSVQAESGGKRSLAVLASSDATGMGFADHLQKELAILCEGSKLFASTRYPFPLKAYTSDALSEAYDRTRAEILTFAYADKDRIALFFFDFNRPGKYIAASETLMGSPTNRITDKWLSNQMAKAFTVLLSQYAVAKFEPIPVAEPEDNMPKEKELTRAEKARRLFSELSELQDGAIYVGTNLGVARFAALTASASTVSVGAYGGVRFFQALRLEAGIDIFSYFMASGNIRYKLPISYASISLGVGGSAILGVVTQNRGFNPTNLPTGTMLFGPTLSLDIPLLGATVRGEIRYLTGSSSVLLATYGLAYTL